MQCPETKLKQDVCTRWNSTYEMFERIIATKDPLLSALAVTNSSTTLIQDDFNCAVEF